MFINRLQKKIQENPAGLCGLVSADSLQPCQDFQICGVFKYVDLLILFLEDMEREEFEKKKNLLWNL